MHNLLKYLHNVPKSWHTVPKSLGLQRLGEQLLQDPPEREEEADLGHSGREPTG